MLGLRFCARAFSSCGERGLLFIAVHGLLVVVASLVVEYGLQFFSAINWRGKKSDFPFSHLRAAVQINWDKAHDGPTCPGRGLTESEMTSHWSFLVDLCSWLPAPEVRRLFCGDQIVWISADGIVRR